MISAFASGLAATATRARGSCSRSAATPSRQRARPCIDAHGRAGGRADRGARHRRGRDRDPAARRRQRGQRVLLPGHDRRPEPARGLHRDERRRDPLPVHQRAPRAALGDRDPDPGASPSSATRSTRTSTARRSPTTASRLRGRAWLVVGLAIAFAFPGLARSIGARPRAARGARAGCLDAEPGLHGHGDRAVLDREDRQLVGEQLERRQAARARSACSAAAQCTAAAMPERAVEGRGEVDVGAAARARARPGASSAA